MIFLEGSLGAWREARSAKARTVVALAMLFIAFAFWGAGMVASLWCLLRLAAVGANYVVMRSMNSRATSRAGSSPVS